MAVIDVLQVRSLPPLMSDVPRLESPVRARVWLRARHFFSRGSAQASCWLWLLAADGRVHAMRLDDSLYGDDAALPALLAVARGQVAGRSTACRIMSGSVQILEDAPVVPVSRWSVSWGNRLQREIRDFAAHLDSAVLEALGDLEEPGPFFGSVGNYNRLIAASPVVRLHRLQALREFPPLVAPLLLDQFDAPNLLGEDDYGLHARALVDTEDLDGNRDPPVLSAIDRGRDLIGALADHYRVDRALVRAPLLRQPLPLGVPDRSLLRLLRHLPAQARPVDACLLSRVMQALRALPDLVQTERDCERLAGAFRRGWDKVWSETEAAFPHLRNALQDSNDFAAGLVQQIAVMRDRRALSQRRLQLSWIARFGPLSLLRASARWHAQPLQQMPVADGLPDMIPALLGEAQLPGGSYRELVTRRALIEEGADMRHCVGSYWHDCVMEGIRIVHLDAVDGSRSTAMYDFRGADEVRPYVQAELRGPCNAAPGPAACALAREVERRLNAGTLRQRVRAVEDGMQQIRTMHVALPPRVFAMRMLDPQTRRELDKLLIWVDRQADWRDPPQELYAGEIAGFGYTDGRRLLHQIDAGDVIELVREPHNPHDSHAVRVEWRGCKLGYLPRTGNADIARRLDSGEMLRARITDCRRETNRYSPLRISVTVVPVCSMPDDAWDKRTAQ